MPPFYKLTSEEPKFPQENLTLKALVKFYADLLFDFDHQDITFREDAIALGELLIHLGIDPVEVKEHWLGHHPFKQVGLFHSQKCHSIKTLSGKVFRRFLRINI